MEASISKIYTEPRLNYSGYYDLNPGKTSDLMKFCDSQENRGKAGLEKAKWKKN